MINRLKGWCETHLLDCIIEENILTLKDVGKFLILEPKYYFSFKEIHKEITEQEYNVAGDDERSIEIINSDYELILSEREYEQAGDIDYLLFEFGRDWFYSDTIARPKLTPFKYLGKAKQEFDEINFYNLGIHGGYDLCNGSRIYKDWVKKGKFLGTKVLGLAEENTLSGVIPFQSACKSGEITSIIGESIKVMFPDGNLIFIKSYVKNREGWVNLLKIHKTLKVDNQNFIDFEDLLKHDLSNLIFVINSEVKIQYFLDTKDIIPELYYSIETTEWDNQEKDEEFLKNLGDYLQNFREVIKPVIICDSFYLERREASARKILGQINNVGYRNNSNDQHFKSIDEVFQDFIKISNDLGSMFEFISSTIEFTYSLFKDIDFKVLTGEFYLPKYVDENGSSSQNELLLLDYIEKGLEEKVVAKGLDFDKYLSRVEYELEIIKKGGFVDYFLILADLYNYCREQGIWYGVGRGSAAGCLISYLCNIVSIDPLEYNLLFERFLNPGRIGKSLPDIDCDFQGTRRDEIKRYLETKYGRDQVISIGTYGTFKLKNAIKDLARLSGVESSYMNYVTAFFPEPERQTPQYYYEVFEQACKQKVVKEFVTKYPRVVEQLQLILSQPKNNSIHAAGMVILPKEFGTSYEQLPVKKQDGLLVSEWEGHYIDDAGFLKVDILGIAQLDKFAKIAELIKLQLGEDVTFNDVVLDEEEVLQLFKDGSTEDVFQFGASGLKAYCKQLQPDTIEDLIATVALYRPGPMESGSHMKYIKRKNNEERVEADPGCDEITSSTYGLIVYQEQVMQICQKVANFSLTEADDIRKALGKMKPEIVKGYRDTFLERTEKNGYIKEQMEALWAKMEAFAAYAFNRCISGDETFYRASHNKSGKSTFRPTIGEMYKIKNDVNYAKKTNHYYLHESYNYNGYGHAFSLNENQRLVKNKIKDIRFIGIKPIYRTTLDNGKTIDTTINHKFPTSNGEKKLEDINIENDLLFYNLGYEQNVFGKHFFKEGNNFPKEGQQGFQKRDTVFTRFVEIEKEIKLKYNSCQICNKENCRLELHHIDGDYSNTDITNYQLLCSSCHKKEEYKNGRVKMGEKGLLTSLVKIKSIEYLKDDEVYDVEMEHPHHTFTTNNNIVTSNSHAACYAITGYYSQWFKQHYPLQFWTVSLQFSGDKEIVGRVVEIQKNSPIQVRPIDINLSHVEFKGDLETNSIYWSLNSVKWVGEKLVDSILEERAKGDFYSLEEFVLRVKGYPGVNKRAISHLIICGAFDLIEKIKNIKERYQLLESFYTFTDTEFKEEYLPMSSWREHEWVLKQKSLSGFGVVDFKKIIHQSTQFAGKINKFKENSEILDFDNSDSESVLVSGVVSNSPIERKSKNGPFCQLQIFDNKDIIYITVWPDIYARYQEELKKCEGKIIIFWGRVEWDSYKQQYSIKSDKHSKLEII